MREGSKRNDSQVSVQCYAGYKGEQEPQRFLLAEGWLEVEEILNQWQEPAAAVFRVRADDGKIYVLHHRQEHPEDEWAVESVNVSL